MISKQFFVKPILSTIAITLLPLTAFNIWAKTSPTPVKAVLPKDLQWKVNPNIKGVKSAIAIGDSSNSQLYVLFGKMDKGAIFPAHTHPDDRITTVISGVMYYGVGDQFDRTKVNAYPAGSVVYTPSGVPHFMWAKNSNTVMQETGFGSTGLRFTTVK